MNPTAKCPTCGRPMPGDAPRKMCPACLFEAAMASRCAPGDDEGSGDGREPAPQDESAATSLPTPGARAEAGAGEWPSGHEILSSWTGVGDVPPRAGVAVDDLPLGS